MVGLAPVLLEGSIIHMIMTRGRGLMAVLVVVGDLETGMVRFEGSP